MKEIETGNLVEEFMQGNVKIRIYDNAYANKTKEDIERILQRINRIGWNIIREAELQQRGSEVFEGRCANEGS